MKAQDILILLKLVALGKTPWNYRDLSSLIGLSISQLHSAIHRALDAKLAINDNGDIFPNILNLEEFLIHGLKYIFIPQTGEITRGFPTAYSAPPLDKLLTSSSESLPLIWPDPNGPVRGSSFAPIHKSAVKAAQSDQKLYELLALVDAIRGGRVREQKIAKDALIERLHAYDQDAFKY